MTNKRINRDTQYTMIAEVISMRATCRRANVGAVITIGDRIVSSGYNGPVKGDKPCENPHCNIDNSCVRAVHAEANAIAFAARMGTPLEGGTLYCTYSPCRKCAELIIQSGIKRVCYATPYRLDEGAELLKSADIELCQVTIKSLQHAGK